MKVYVPRDAAALALGADAVAAALQAECTRRGLAIELVRNGSRGLFWLEPLVEVDTTAGRVAYGPVTPEDVPSLLDAGLPEGGDHPLGLGTTEAIPYLARQERLCFARMGVVDPLSLADHEAHSGWAGLRQALAMDGAAIVQTVLDSGLRGRGGAAFPAGIKWRTVRETPAAQKYVVCNADEGDSGTFSDRMAMEGDPFGLIEGLAIAGLAVGATRGYVYIRSEYPHAYATMAEAVRLATEAGFLGDDVLGSGRAFHLEQRRLLAADVAAGGGRALRTADAGAQRDHAGQRAGHPGARRSVVSRLRPRPLARHPALPAGRQRQTRRAGREGLRPDAARAGLRLRRRHAQRPAGQGHPGGRPAGHLRARSALG